MRRLSILIALVASVAIAAPALAAPPARLLTFGTGDATLTGLSSVTLVNDAGEYSGVYLHAARTAKSIGSVDFSFTYSGTIAGGAPRFSIPIDTDGNGTVEGYAFIDANSCGATTTSGSGTVSTELATCKVYFLNDVYANWDAFVLANPTYRLPPGSVPFIIADQPGTYVITGIDLS
jgi:hypothetical protein